MLTAYEAADFFIELTQSEEEEFMTPLRLQKLLYFAQGWSLARHGRPLFHESIVAWKYGPVVREVYEKYKPYMANPIIQPTARLDLIQGEDLSLLLDVYREYGCYTAKMLVRMTHQTKPWLDAVQGMEIPIESMRSYFSALTTQLPSFEDEIEQFLPVVEGYRDQNGVTIFPQERLT